MIEKWIKKGIAPMGPLFKLEWRQNKKSFWIALCATVILQAIPAIVSKTYLQHQASNRPDFSNQAAVPSSFEEWMAGQPFMFSMILLGCFAMIWSAGSIAKERDRQTAEFLFAAPRSRTAIFMGKCAAHLVQVLCIVILSAGIVLTIGKSLNVMRDAAAIVGLTAAGLLVVLCFMGIGYALSPWLATERGAMSSGIGIVFLMFLFYLLSQLTELNWLGIISLFNLFDIHKISQGDNIAWSQAITAGAIFFAGSIMGWLKLVKRDL
jgi:ABC-type transport system involved in multi-copper enzyme maturation permease subunit